MVHLGVNAVRRHRTSRWPSSPPGPATTSPGSSGCRAHDAAAAARAHRQPAGCAASTPAVAEDDARVVRWWLGVLGAGFDAVVNERANGCAWPTGRARYYVAVAARAAGVPRRSRTSSRSTGSVVETEAMLVAVANGPLVRRGHAGLPGRRPRRRAARRHWCSREISELGRSCASSRGSSRARTSSTRRWRSCAGPTVRLEAAGVVAYADGERVGPLPLTCAVGAGRVAGARPRLT